MKYRTVDGTFEVEIVEDKGRPSVLVRIERPGGEVRSAVFSPDHGRNAAMGLMSACDEAETLRRDDEGDIPLLKVPHGEGTA